LDARDGEPDTFYVARLGATGEPLPAGGVRLGLDRRELLRAVLVDREVVDGRRRRRILRVTPGIELVVESHGRSDGPVRDAVIRDVLIEPWTGPLGRIPRELRKSTSEGVTLWPTSP
jgi:hypothetical protein